MHPQCTAFSFLFDLPLFTCTVEGQTVSVKKCRILHQSLTQLGFSACHKLLCLHSAVPCLVRSLSHL